VSFIAVENVSKVYSENGASSRVRVLSGVDALIKEGEFVCLMGPSGSGKSTLLTIVGAMNHPTEGKVLVDGIDVYDLPDEHVFLDLNRQGQTIFMVTHNPENAALADRTLNIVDGLLAGTGSVSHRPAVQLLSRDIGVPMCSS